MAGRGSRAARKPRGGIVALERPRQGLAPHESSRRDSHGAGTVAIYCDARELVVLVSDQSAKYRESTNMTNQS